MSEVLAKVRKGSRTKTADLDIDLNLVINANSAGHRKHQATNKEAAEVTYTHTLKRFNVTYSLENILALGDHTQDLIMCK